MSKDKKIMEMAEVIRRARQELGSGLILPEETATALHKAGYRKQGETVKEFAEKLKEKIEFREQELIISCKQIEETDMLECDLFRTAREYGLYNIIDQLAKEYGVEVEKC